MFLPFASPLLWTITVLLLIVVSVSSPLAITYVYTTVKYRVDLYQYKLHGKNKPHVAPQIPYTVPWLGNSLSFLVLEPHKFWRTLFTWYPRSAGACKILLGGETTNVIFNRHASQYLMADRKLGRERFNKDVLINGLGLSEKEYRMFYGLDISVGEEKKGRSHDLLDKINLDYMLKADKANELTMEFSRSLEENIQEQDISGSKEINLYQWIRTLVFRASAVALLGDKVLEICPNLEDQFFQFDQDLLSLFFGFPKWMISAAYKNRDETVGDLTKWHQYLWEVTDGTIPDPDGTAWEPLYGSRLNRRRQCYYRERRLGMKAWAASDLGLLFGLSSNSVPAAGWMLMHILDSTRTESTAEGGKNLYDHVMMELKTARRPDGSIDVPTLVNLPVLRSTLHEVLRVYVDVLISRVIPHDLTLPLSDSNDPNPSSLAIKKDSLLMVPTWPAHHDQAAWQAQYPDHPPTDQFYPYRFLNRHPDDDDTEEKLIFTTSHANGLFFPFGGGKTMCPGRTFGKQEMLAAVAVILLEFDITTLGFVTAKGIDTDQFPGFRDTLPGSAVMVPSGDIKVRIERRRRA